MRTYVCNILRRVCEFKLNFYIYLQGEIIGDKYSFLTNKWDADERVDDEHWVSDLWVLGQSDCICLVFFLGPFLHNRHRPV